MLIMWKIHTIYHPLTKRGIVKLKRRIHINYWDYKSYQIGAHNERKGQVYMWHQLISMIWMGVFLLNTNLCCLNDMDTDGDVNTQTMSVRICQCDSSKATQQTNDWDLSWPFGQVIDFLLNMLIFNFDSIPDITCVPSHIRFSHFYYGA